MPAEPGLLRILFFPQKHIQLEIEAALHFDFLPSDLNAALRDPSSSSIAGLLFNQAVNANSQLQYTVTLHNIGMTTVKGAYVLVYTDDLLSYNQSGDWIMRPHANAQVSFQARRAFHPGEAISLFSATFDTVYRNFSESADVEDIRPSFETRHLRFALFAEDIQQQTARVEFRPQELDIQTGTATKTVLLA